jgi:hypothetical protein
MRRRKKKQPTKLERTSRRLAAVEWSLTLAYESCAKLQAELVRLTGDFPFLVAARSLADAMLDPPSQDWRTLPECDTFREARAKERGPAGVFQVYACAPGGTFERAPHLDVTLPASSVMRSTACDRHVWCVLQIGHFEACAPIFGAPAGEVMP